MESLGAIGISIFAKRLRPRDFKKGVQGIVTFYKLILLLMLTLVYALAWKIQDQLILNYDVSWLIHATRRLLDGGTYSQDFFETNPPMILYLYFPPVLLSKFLYVNIILIFRIYVFLLATLSLGLCYILERKFFTNKNFILTTLFNLTIAFVFLILPFSSLGQRDHKESLFKLDVYKRKRGA